MNRFGRQAMQAWAEFAPQSLAELPDPKAFFTRLGQEAEYAWVDLGRQLAGPDLPGETFQQKVGRLTNARLQAEELIRVDWLMPPSSTSDQTPATQQEAEEPDLLSLGGVWAEMDAEREAEYEQEAALRRQRLEEPL